MKKVTLIARPALAEARKEKGYTQNEICHLLYATFGVKATQGLYTKWESADRPVSGERALQIARILEKDIKVLFHAQ